MRHALLVVVTSAMSAVAPHAYAQGPNKPAAAPAAPAVDPAAIAALEKMAAFLRTQQDFQVTSETTTDDVLPSGQKVQLGALLDLKVRRPNRLRVDVTADRKTERIFYDGNIFTVFQPKPGYYASFAAPPNLRELVDVLERRYGIDLPLADLFRLGTDAAQLGAIRGATLVGYSTVKGAPCAHYAFHQPDVDWELWIEEGTVPVPRKLVVTTITEKTQPQHVSVMSWSLGARLDDQMFVFSPPPGAQRIDFAEGSASAPSAQRQGRATSRKGGTGTP